MRKSASTSLVGAICESRFARDRVGGARASSRWRSSRQPTPHEAGACAWRRAAAETVPASPAPTTTLERIRSTGKIVLGYRPDAGADVVPRCVGSADGLFGRVVHQSRRRAEARVVAAVARGASGSRSARVTRTLEQHRGRSRLRRRRGHAGAPRSPRRSRFRSSRAASPRSSRTMRHSSCSGRSKNGRRRTSRCGAARRRRRSRIARTRRSAVPRRSTC